MDKNHIIMLYFSLIILFVALVVYTAYVGEMRGRYKACASMGMVVVKHSHTGEYLCGYKNKITYGYGGYGIKYNITHNITGMGLLPS
jgi:hypothetical protein